MYALETAAKNITVLGAGAWGTALACLLAKAGHRVRIWAYEPEVAEAINQTHENTIFLPERPLPESLIASSELAEALDGSVMVVLVMPSHVFRQVLVQAAERLPAGATLVSCAKGIEQDTGYTMCEITQDVLSRDFSRNLCALSGPSFAREVAAGAPTTVTVASRNTEAARAVQLTFSTPYFRVYTSPDVIGVELGGAVKNPLAIAAGMCSGLKLGHNTLAALITRGLAEMTRLSQSKGGQMATLSGLAGLGDLVLTCTGDLSRNRSVGLRLAQGETIEEITGSMKTVAEGVRNTRTVMNLCRRLGVDMPIVRAVEEVIYERKPPLKALHELMTRGLKPEHY